MSERLRPRDLAILAAESPTTPMHNATVEIFDPGTSGFDHDRLVQLIADRIAAHNIDLNALRERFGLPVPAATPL